MTKMIADKRWTSADLEVFPDDGKRYEIIVVWISNEHLARALDGVVCRSTGSSTGSDAKSMFIAIPALDYSGRPRCERTIP